MTERVNKENYEAFLLDFLEGNLSETDAQALQLFLEKNPALKRELEDAELLFLEPESLPSASLKTNLLREETTGLLRKDYLMIAQIEGTIEEKEKAELSHMIMQNPSISDELALYHKTRLATSEEVLFPNKEALLKEKKVMVLWWRYAAAAAAVFLFFYFNWDQKEGMYQPKEMAFYAPDLSVEQAQHALVVQDEAIGEEKENLPRQAMKATTANAIALNRPVNKQAKFTEKQRKETIESKVSNGNEFNEVAQIPIEEQASPKVEEEAPVNFSSEEERLAELSPNREKEYTPIGEYAKNKLKNELLKGKTFSETVLEELKELGEKKLDLEIEENKEGETAGFALNIGKFGFSRNK